ncbi:alpha/beta fold hydrolase [Falsiroseomonas selenitidurans]|uniref:Alpha/beta hydrolase n=1 Tax=Falsiroseomonas selenitidurans TaxID=2716335 RepID=A0ABX1E4Q2_9PROT|nr:alpha/beta hydrolase [Falsiroseomonas selenitidurans]NKC32179.1 alpha/beta hydrolase [Falsiroseomonas selenitidurans]
MFEGFVEERRAGDGVTLRLRRGGEGPPLLLLHGNPQTHAMWNRVAPDLAKRFTVVCPDLRGYGFSGKPSPSADHAAYAKRAMAADMLALMQGLGFPAFQVVAHDRGARVAHRLALDTPQAVRRLCVMDIVPTLHHFETADMDFALGYHHWFFLAQPHPKPERMILRDVEDWFASHTSRGQADVFAPEARADYIAALHQPGTVMGICEDYRAATSIDLEHDRASRAAGRKVDCPLLALWGAKGKIQVWYDALAVWRDYASGPVSGHSVPSGHYLAEEAPDEVLAALGGFLER